MIREGMKLKKLLAGILTAACVVTSMPMGVYAEGAGSSQSAEEIVEAAQEADGSALLSEESVVTGETAFEEVITDDAVEAADAYADEAEDKDTPEEAVEVSESDQVYADQAALDFTKATAIEAGKEVKNGSATKDDFAVYKFTPKTTGRYTVSGTASDDVRFRLTDSTTYQTTTDFAYYYHDNGLNHALDNEPFDLIAGKTYYITVEPEDYNAADDITFSFTLSLAYEVTLSSKDTAVEMTFGKEYEGHLCHDEFMSSRKVNLEYVKNYYKFTLKEPATFTLHVEDDSSAITSPKTYTRYTICTDPVNYDKDTGDDFSWQYHTHDKGGYTTDCAWINTGNESDEAKLSLLAGEYYLVIFGKFNVGYDHPLNYMVSLKDYKPLKTLKSGESLLVDTRLHGSNDKENFEDKGYSGYYKDEDMPDIEIGKVYRGIHTLDSYVDCYHFKLDKTGPLYLTLESEDCIGECRISLTYWSENKGVVSLHLDKDYYSTPDIKLDSVQMQNAHSEKVMDHYKNHPEFLKGDYVLTIESKATHDDDKRINLGQNGQYKFKLSTAKSTVKPVSTLKLDNTSIKMSKGDKATFTATVGPKETEDRTVSYSVEPAGIIKVTQKDQTEEQAAAGITEFEVEALKDGSATIAVTTNGTNSKNAHITEYCMVSVFDIRKAPNIPKGMKLDLSGAQYFGESIDKKSDKFVLDSTCNKKVGSASKGVFTAKAAGDVILIRQVKDPDTKKYKDVDAVKFTVEAPVYPQKDTKGRKPKDIKSYASVIRGEKIQISGYVACGSISPVRYEIPEKAKKNFQINEATGELTVLASGSCKVTVLFEDNARTKAKLTFSVKSTLPVVKAPKSVKTTATKPATVKLNKVRKGIPAEEISWRLEGVTADGLPNGEEVGIEVGNIVKGENGISAQLSGISAGTVAVIANVDGADYWSIVKITE